jgi:hypothetical protein
MGEKRGLTNSGGVLMQGRHIERVPDSSGTVKSPESRPKRTPHSPGWSWVRCSGFQRQNKQHPCTSVSDPLKRATAARPGIKISGYPDRTIGAENPQVVACRPTCPVPSLDVLKNTCTCNLFETVSSWPTTYSWLACDHPVCASWSQI